MSFILEVCVDSVESAIEAQKGGANRIELCSNLIIGGTSPSLALFQEVHGATDIKIHVLLRPRAGDFCYSDFEFNIIKKEILIFKKAGADGIVIGILKPDGTMNKSRMKELMKCAGDMHVTLHRAFDMCADPYATLELAKEIGIHTILTSGQENHIQDGLKLVKELVQLSADDINILVGSGVSGDNTWTIYNETKATCYHLSGKEIIESKMEYRKEKVSMGLDGLNEYQILRTNQKKIEAVHRILSKYLV